MPIVIDRSRRSHDVIPDDASGRQRSGDRRHQQVGSAIVRAVVVKGVAVVQHRAVVHPAHQAATVAADIGEGRRSRPDDGRGGREAAVSVDCQFLAAEAAAVVGAKRCEHLDAAGGREPAGIGRVGAARTTARTAAVYRQASIAVGRAAAGNIGVVTLEEAGQLGVEQRGEHPGIDQRLQPGLQLGQAVGGVARRQAAVLQVGVIGLKCRDIVGIDRQAGKAVGRTAARNVVVIACQEGQLRAGEQAVEHAGIDQCLKIGLQLRRGQRRIGRRQAAALEIGVIGRKRRLVGGIDWQARPAIHRAAIGQVREVARQQRGIGPQQFVEPPGVDDRLNVAAQHGEIEAGIAARQAAARQIGRIGIECGGEGRIVRRHRQPGVEIRISTLREIGEEGTPEVRQGAEEPGIGPGGIDRRQIGADLFLRQRGIAGRHAAGLQIVIIGLQRRGIASEDVEVQPFPGIEAATTVEEGQVLGIELGIAAQEPAGRPGIGQRLQVGLQRGGIDGGIFARPAA